MNERYLINEGISYEYIKRMEEHAKQYDYVSDKKTFLRSISPYEQKLVLLNSKKPYEVLSYLDELDIKTTRKILNELTYDEIKQVLSLFTSEDKKRFYKNYSDLALVNQFIVYDKNASEHIDNLSFDRKVELIDSSNSKTLEATSKVYESMSEDQREKVNDMITESSAVSALSEAQIQVENSVSDSEVTVENNNTIESPEDNHVKETIIDEIKEELQNPEEEKQTEKEETEQQQEKKQVDIPLESPENQEDNNEIETLNLFQQAKQETELNFINNIKNEIINRQVNEQLIESSNQKTL